MNEEDAAEEIEGRDEEEVVLSVTAFTEQAFEAGNQSYGDCDVN